MYQFLGGTKGTAIIEDLENNIIYAVYENEVVHVYRNYDKLHTSVDSIPQYVMMEIMKTLFESMDKNKKDNPDVHKALDAIKEANIVR